MLVQGIVLISLITLNINCINVDSIFKDTPFTNQIHQKVLKEWKVYIDEYLELLIPFVFSFDTNVKNFLLVQHQHVANFVQKSRAIALQFNFDNSISKIKNASGKLFLHSKMNKLWTGSSFKHKENINSNIKAIFAMDKRLSLNITFDTLFFASGQYDCKLGNLSVFELIYVGYRKTTKLTHSFCGYHSEFSIYPQRSTFLVSITARVNILLVLNATFSVMDSNLLKSFQKVNCSYEYQFSNIFIFQNSWIVSSYLVQVQKTHKIKMKFPQTYLTFHLVYDGPGSMSDILNSKVNMDTYFYNCSSFQCLVKFFTNDIKNIFVNYSSIQLPVMVEKMIQSTGYFTIFGSQCYIVPCVVLISAPVDLQVNVTILEMSYKSKNMELPNTGCIYGGLVFTEGSNEDYLENNPFCKNHNSSQEVSRSYYSSNSTLIMVLYSYEKYSAIEVTLELSLTKCKPITLNFYDLLTFCQDSNHPYNNCSSYLRQITEGTSLSLSFGSDHNILFSISKEECVVLLLDERLTHDFYLLEKRQKLFDFKEEPTFTLSSELINKFGVKMDYRIIGTFCTNMVSCIFS